MKFEVLEREHLKAALSEHQLIASGIMDVQDSDIAGTGQKQSVPCIIYGIVQSFTADKAVESVDGKACAVTKSEIELLVKLANAETGGTIAVKTVVGHGMDKVVVAEWGSHSADHGIHDAIDEASHVVADWLRDLLCPAKVLKVDKAEITVDMNENEVKEGDVFDVIEKGGVIVDPETGAALEIDGKCIGRVVITRPGLRTSKAKPVDGGRLSIEKLDTRKHVYKLRRVTKTTSGTQDRSDGIRRRRLIRRVTN